METLYDVLETCQAPEHPVGEVLAGRAEAGMDTVHIETLYDVQQNSAERWACP